MNIFLFLTCCFCVSQSQGTDGGDREEVRVGVLPNTPNIQSQVHFNQYFCNNAAHYQEERTQVFNVKVVFPE